MTLNLSSRFTRRNMVIGSAAVFAAAPLARFGIVSAQTEYTAPDNIDEISGSFEADGSSTVGPLTEAVIEEFAAVASGITITNGISGSGGGFKRFVTGETAISNASRPIAEDEVALAAENGIGLYQLDVAYDGITVVVNAENDWVDSMTVEQLQQLWSADGGIVNWSDINPDWPAEPIELYGPGADSGTFDYFNEAILGDDVAVRTDYIPSEDDNVLVQGVIGSVNALGYFGFAYFVENQDSLRAVPIDGGNGPVEPSIETIGDGSYAPLSRSLFIYVNAEMLQSDPALQEFVRFYLAMSDDLADDVGYIALPEEALAEEQTKLEGAISGEVAPDSDAGGATPEASPAA
ncbi:MAG: PstS family phosphate ABC transporter substrate-binding protein [Chloroflexia bacterium]|nr:PstS family phosphate ABC transporter substrate-binding protein [Chloroflexia bacterium]